ncbi:esterase E4-like [Homalodisca vitripennis]|uniref:esterase E4-like n=1 Tax=Homalodisca vitripennis TaxID=197043 RepID=UPI001EEC8C69|nr:esterase E4-like [Homalodisca vitripennis]
MHYLLFVFSLLCCSVIVKTVIVRTEHGSISGTEFKTSQGKLVNAFLGIPYAKPPVNELRFKEPQLIDNWTGVRSGQNFSSKCIQFIYYADDGNNIEGDEDCLYLNIFTPSASSDSKLEVVFYIHGGAYMFGSSDSFTPYFILDNLDIVFVTFNYRLGPFGFLSTEDEVVPGNNGMKDQVLALKWVRKNIKRFGGDKNKITIAGHSAGGSSVHLHYLSPLSKRLFHQGISVSGSALCPWVLAENSRAKSQLLADSVGCPTDNSNSLVDCLRSKPAKSLLLKTEELFMPWHFNPFSPFGPVVEKNSSEAFLDKDPYELLKEGNIKDAPWLTSMTTEEGLYPASTFLKNNKLMKELDENWNKIAPHLLDYNNTVAKELQDEISDKIKKFYFGNKNISTAQTAELVRMLSDRLFAADIEKAARLHASVTSSPVYFYSFSYRGTYSAGNFFCNCNDNWGASHGDDLLYLLTTGYGSYSIDTEEDKEMVDTMVNIWISFIQSGFPTASPEAVWIPVAPDAEEDGNLNFLQISSSKDIKPSSSLDLGNRKFWDHLHLGELRKGDEKRKHADEL